MNTPTEIRRRYTELLAAERRVTAAIIAKHGSFDAPPCPKYTTHNVKNKQSKS